MKIESEPLTPTDRSEFLNLWHDELSAEFIKLLPDTPPNKLQFLIEHLCWKAWKKGRRP